MVKCSWMVGVTFGFGGLFLLEREGNVLGEEVGGKSESKDVLGLICNVCSIELG